MKLTKTKREQVRMKFGGMCAYCGKPLGDRWHADHFAPVERRLQYVRGKGLVATGEFHRPHNDRMENIMPSCPPCNIDKGSLPIEAWREKLQGAPAVLMRNNPTYRHALRFGLLSETGEAVRFRFESPNGQS